MIRTVRNLTMTTLGLGVLLCTATMVATAVAAEPPEDWLVNRRGIEALGDDFVLPPFTPVSASGNGRVDVWGRQYQLDPFGLVQQVTVHGTPLLEKPMTFDIQLAGRAVQFTPAGRTLVKAAKGRVEFMSRATSDQADLEVKTTVEYDGMVRVDFTIVPHGRVELTGFRYRVHYPEATARFIHYLGAKQKPESQNLPKNSYSRAVPEGEGTVWRSPFKTLVWLGDYEKGFLWFCGSEQHWSPQERAERPEGVTVSRTQREVVLQVTPVSRSYMLNGPATYTFGLFATPVRPLTPGWRGWTCNYHNTALAMERANPGLNVNLAYLSGMHVAPFYQGVKDPDAYRRAADELHARGRIVLQYFDAACMALGQLKKPTTLISGTWQPPDLELDQTGANERSEFAWKPPEFKYFNAWKTEPTHILGYCKEAGHRQYTTGIGSQFADLFCYHVEQHALAGCDGSIDIDEWYPVPDMNPRHGMGYVDQQGVRRPEYDWWAKRDLMKRLCAVFLKVRGRAPIMIAHTASMLAIPCTSFCDGILTGENLNTGYFARETCFDEYFRNKGPLQECLRRGGEHWYYYAAPPDRWAVEASGKQFGFAVLVMANLTKSKDLNPELAKSEKATRDMLAMAVVHDNLVWPIFCDPKPVIRLWKIRQQFGIAEGDVEFLPFWGRRHLAETSAPDVVVSAYRKGAKCLINVANLGLTPQPFSLKFNPAELGNYSIQKLYNAETGNELSLVDGGVKVSLPERDYCVIVAELKGAPAARTPKPSL